MCAEFAKICLAGQPAFSEQRLLCTQEPDFFLNSKMRDEAALIGSPDYLFKRMGVSLLLYLSLVSRFDSF
ncbi:hypothetical protein TSAR_004427 [Trichomalopsis sarcophagae]|uniref:Uncharacterized protein n=1 Tax=Trichomalopsis sarcophagae TaxID=543379 RepID=A0A232FAT1_9HYME|nr:hypothetical protein TSAR_004427 [Trichomalopsis sarcophagae]